MSWTVSKRGTHCLDEKSFLRMPNKWLETSGGCPREEEQTFKDDPARESNLAQRVIWITKAGNHKTVPQLERALTLTKMRLG